MYIFIVSDPGYSYAYVENNYSEYIEIINFTSLNGNYYTLIKCKKNIFFDAEIRAYISKDQYISLYITACLPPEVTTPVVVTTQEEVTTSVVITTPQESMTMTEYTTAVDTTITSYTGEQFWLFVNQFGDVNSDGIIDLSDLTTLSLNLLGDVTLNDAETFAADVVFDGLINLADLASLKMYTMDNTIHLGFKYSIIYK